ncbi:MAG: ABC transporter permease subunit [Actinomycetota bacterium]|nr:ABC transporter permease subunit [Actinomycetota bacterium]
MIRALFLGSAALALVVNAAIVVSLLDGAVDFLSKLGDGPGFGSLVSSHGWFPRRGFFDVRTIFVGTVMISLVAMVVATPLGLGAAMYLSEYAGPKARRRLKPVLEVLAGVPSVVMAYFVISFISPSVVQKLSSEATFYNMAAAGIGVGILVSPIVASVAEDALHAVPVGLREAAYGLGARPRAASTRVVFPAAISGIIAALILGLSRAVGETLVVTIAAGGTGGSALTFDIFGPGQTMTAAMTTLATGSDQVRGASTAFPSLFFVGLLLFVLTLSLNVVSERFVRRFRRGY